MASQDQLQQKIAPATISRKRDANKSLSAAHVASALSEISSSKRPTLTKKQLQELKSMFPEEPKTSEQMSDDEDAMHIVEESGKHLINI